MLPRMARMIGLWALLLSTVAGAAGIPPTPTGDDYLLDQAGLIGSADETHLRALQQSALQQYNSPLVVVTISRVSDFGEPNVEALATRWFNAWNIGTLGLQGGANQGMLLLVSVEDHRARIELGSDWGRDWDAHARQIMDEKIVPRFKSGNFSSGIVDGVEALVAMAKAGPHSQPPGDFLTRRVRPLSKYSLLEPKLLLGVAGLGLVLILFGLFGTTDRRGTFIAVDAALIIGAFFTYVVVGLFLVIFGQRRRSSFFDGGGGGGGGFSGGSSGGGGASGSW
jgi:uncharacterized protein